MKKMPAILIVFMLLGFGSVANAQVSFGFRIGPPPPPRIVRTLPHRPGPEFYWIDGYWYPSGNHYRWHDGYWTRPPYVGARWIGPRYNGGQFYLGHWDGGRGRFEHDHRSDHRRDRDYRNDRRDRNDRRYRR